MIKLSPPGKWVIIISDWHKDYFLCKDNNCYYRTSNIFDAMFFDDLSLAKENQKQCKEKRAYIKQITLYAELE